MVNLARRKKHITVDLPDTDATLTVETLSQPEYSEAVGDAMAKAMRDGQIDPDMDEGEVDLPIGPLISAITRFAHRKIVSAENIDVEGEPFNPHDDSHLDALPGQWMVTVASDLAQEATLSEKEGKGFTEPDAPSIEESTAGDGSRRESVGS